MVKNVRFLASVGIFVKDPLAVKELSKNIRVHHSFSNFNPVGLFEMDLIYMYCSFYLNFRDNILIIIFVCD
jgi:hypothetical protein